MGRLGILWSNINVWLKGALMVEGRPRPIITAAQICCCLLVMLCKLSLNHQNKREFVTAIVVFLTITYPKILYLAEWAIVAVVFDMRFCLNGGTGAE